MLTIFTTAKPFREHIGIIQRNALRSWKLLHLDIEVILFGNDEGAAQVSRELGIRHEPHTEKNEFGLNRVDYMFQRAQELARHDVLCYSNCDIMLMQDFCHALGLVKAAHSKFLMVGRRWDTEISEPYDFERNDWRTRLRSHALHKGKQRPPEYIDYFVFPRGMLGADLPALAVGRAFWDNWTVWKVLDSKHPVVDVSPVVIAVHQKHDYRHHPQGEQGLLSGEASGRNYKLAGGWKHLRTIADATEILRADGLKPNLMRYLAAAKRYVRQAGRLSLYDLWRPIWFYLLDVTRPVRNALGLRAKNPRRSR